MKKYLFILFVLMLLPVMANADDSGTCGDNLTWAYVELTHTLTISGTGDMNNYSSKSQSPWHSYNSYIDNVIIKTGVTSIGDCAFYGCRLKSVTIPNSVTSIGFWAFGYCFDLTSVTIPSSVTLIGERAFENCI